jgi:hypothetical protein
VKRVIWYTSNSVCVCVCVCACVYTGCSLCILIGQSSGKLFRRLRCILQELRQFSLKFKKLSLYLTITSPLPKSDSCSATEICYSNFCCLVYRGQMGPFSLPHSAPYVADGGKDLQIWRVDANRLNKQ